MNDSEAQPTKRNLGLIAASTIALGIASFLGSAYIVAVLLWWNVYGDNDTDGVGWRYAVAIAAVLAIVVVWRYGRYCLSKNVGRRFLVAVLLVSCFLSVLLLWPAIAPVLIRFRNRLLRWIAAVYWG